MVEHYFKFMIYTGTLREISKGFRARNSRNYKYDYISVGDKRISNVMVPSPLEPALRRQVGKLVSISVYNGFIVLYPRQIVAIKEENGNLEKYGSALGNYDLFGFILFAITGIAYLFIVLFPVLIIGGVAMEMNVTFPLIFLVILYIVVFVLVYGRMRRKAMATLNELN